MSSTKSVRGLRLRVLKRERKKIKEGHRVLG